MVHNNKAGQIILTVVMVLLVAFCVIPFLLIVMSSFTEESTLMRDGYSFFPANFSFEAYVYILKSGSKIIRGYGISILVTVIGTSVSMLITTLFAYPLSRRDLPFRKGISFFVFFTMLFNGGLIPSYMMWTQIFHIKNTLAALIIPALLMNAFYIIMMRTYFQSSIPMELIESVQIDGGSEWRILLNIIVPLSKPILATLGFMVALGYWNDWTLGLYYITDTTLYGIQNILNRILSDIQFLSSATSSGMGTDMSSVAASMPSTAIRMAIAVVGVLPMLIIYPFFQKYLVKGITIGAVKG